jgi:hypothetical protein
MSALGHKRTFSSVRARPAFHPKADIAAYFIRATAYYLILRIGTAYSDAY